MLPFHVELKAGESPYRRTVYAATRAIVSGELPPGAPFPSVRELSQALKINPNTAHKVVSELRRTGLLDVRPGIGTVVAEGRKARPEERRELLSRTVEELVVEAKRLGVSRDEVEKALARHWLELTEQPDEAGAGERLGPPSSHSPSEAARTRSRAIDRGRMG